MSRPEPTTDEPSAIMEWADAGGSPATDGCWLEQDVTECEHRHPSWCVVLGFVPDVRGE